MRVLAVGDVCGSRGCETALKLIPKLKRSENIDFVIVNGENSAEGNGITPQSAEMLFSAGADVITGGNHSMRRREIFDMLDSNPFLLRPDNIPAEFGRGYSLVDMGRRQVAVINLCGQIYLEKCEAQNPFLAADRLIAQAKGDGATQIFVDFHAEATSEKRALGFYLDGRVTAIFGTHTHALTGDAQVLPGGTGYITDIGMTGAENSVLGVKTEIIIDRLKNGGKKRFEFENSSGLLSGCIFETDDKTGLTTGVKPIYVKEDAFC